MRRRPLRAATVLLAAALVPAFAACGTGGPLYDATPVPLTDLPTLSPEEIAQQEAEVEAKFLGRLLTVDDLPAADWVALPAAEEDDSDDTGGVCVFDFDDRITADDTLREDAAAFSSQGLATMISESSALVPNGVPLTGLVLADLRLCEGPKEGSDGATSLTVTSTPSALEVPGSAAGGCRDAQLVIDGTPAVGTFCIGASEDRVMTIAVITIGPTLALSPDQLTALLGTAMAKVTAGPS